MSDTPTNKVFTIVVYHDHCIDGMTAYWATAKGLGLDDTNHVALACSYKPEDEEAIEKLVKWKYLGYGTYGVRLVVVDYSISVELIDALSDYIDIDITICDHHQTAFDRYGVTPDPDIVCRVNLRDKVTLYLAQHLSGAGICWEVFNSIGRINDPFPAPWLVNYVQDRDLWRKESPHTDKVHKYLLLQDRTLARWRELHILMKNSADRTRIYAQGEVLLDQTAALVQECIANPIPVILGGIPGLAVTAPYSLASDIGHELAKISGTYGVVYRLTDARRKVYSYSIRSIDADICNVEKIAKMYGGGGHKPAAGFTRSGVLEDWCFLDVSEDVVAPPVVAPHSDTPT